MKQIFTQKWLEASLVRAIKTFFQTFIATIGSAMVLTEVNWQVALSASVLAAILSIGTSIAGLPELKEE